MARNTTTRDKHRAIIKRDQPPCAHRNCLFPGEPIDYDAHHLDPRAFVVDHITPLSITGPDGDTLDNKQAMHRACNRDKSNKVDYRPGVTFVTERDWWNRSPVTAMNRPHE